MLPALTLDLLVYGLYLLHPGLVEHFRLLLVHVGDLDMLRLGVGEAELLDLLQLVLYLLRQLVLLPG